MKRLLFLIITSFCLISAFSQEADSTLADKTASDKYTAKPFKKDNGFGMRACFGIGNGHYGSTYIKNENNQKVLSSLDVSYPLSGGFNLFNRWYLAGNEKMRFGIEARWIDIDFTGKNEQYYNNNRK